MPAKGHMAEACALGRGDETVTPRNAARRPPRQQRTAPDAPPSVRVRIAAVGAVIGIAVAAPVIVGAVIPVGPKKAKAATGTYAAVEVAARPGKALTGKAASESRAGTAEMARTEGPQKGTRPHAGTSMALGPMQ
jgi:hypothetical protein